MLCDKCGRPHGELEHAEGVLRDVAARPQLYSSAGPAAARVLAELDTARDRVAELEAENERLRGERDAAVASAQALAKTFGAPRRDPARLPLADR